MFSAQLKEERKRNAREKTIENVMEWSHKNPYQKFRLYETAAGLRLLFTDRLYNPTSEEVAALLDVLGSDKLYRRLTVKQECFRARLTPKPWRCGCFRPPSRYPWETEQEEQTYRQWEADYNNKIGGYGICRLITTIGDSPEDTHIASIIELHDQYTCLVPTLPCVAFVLILLTQAQSPTGILLEWIEQVVPKAIQANPAGVCTYHIGDLPQITVTPTKPGRQLVRGSIPFSPGTFPEGLGITVGCNEVATVADVRVLTRHPGTPPSVRRAMITFPYHFSDTTPHTFALALTDAKLPDSLLKETTQIDDGVLLLTTQGDIFVSGYEVTFSNTGGTLWSASLVAPELVATSAPHLDIVEQGAHYLWVRLLVPDSTWPRIMELQMDSVGGIAVRAHVQRLLPGNDTAPDLGWEITGLNVPDTARYAFSEENSEPFFIATDDAIIRFPRAHKEKRGHVKVADNTISFLRCGASEGVAFQETAWRSAALALTPTRFQSVHLC